MSNLSASLLNSSYTTSPMKCNIESYEIKSTEGEVLFRITNSHSYYDQTTGNPTKKVDKFVQVQCAKTNATITVRDAEVANVLMKVFSLSYTFLST